MGTISTVFSILLVLMGGACTLVVVNTKTLRDSRDDFAVRIKQLEEERVLDKAAIAERDTAVTFWRSAARGDEKLDQLIELVVSFSELLKTHHGEARQNWVLVTTGLGHLGQATDHMSESVDALVDQLSGDDE